jgi:hypothetical protein
MSANSKKSIGWSILLVSFGIVALFGGIKWLTVLIPAAMLVWYGASPALRSGRN